MVAAKIKQLSLILICLISVSAHAEEYDHKFGIGLGYPYLSLQARPHRLFIPELRLAFGGGVNVYSVRIYSQLFTYKEMRILSGVEGGYIMFDTMDMEGSGYEGAFLVGVRYPIMKNMDFIFDVSPTYIKVASEGVDVKGVEFILNFSIYYNFKYYDRHAVAERRKDTFKKKKEKMKKHFIEGQKYFKSGNYEKAIESYKKVLKLDPGHELSKKNIKRAKYLLYLEKPL
ncbi:tetratricopeptide repeat protein [Elusimicrobiota bacterium]